MCLERIWFCLQETRLLQESHTTSDPETLPFSQLVTLVPSCDCLPNSVLLLPGTLCFGFLVIEINAKQWSWITMKPSMKPTWKCRRGGKIKTHYSQTPHVSNCLIWSFTFKYLHIKSRPLMSTLDEFLVFTQPAFLFSSSEVQPLPTKELNIHILIKGGCFYWGEVNVTLLACQQQRRRTQLSSSEFAPVLGVPPMPFAFLKTVSVQRVLLSHPQGNQSRFILLFRSLLSPILLPSSKRQPQKKKKKKKEQH